MALGDEVLQERVSHVYPTTVSLKHDGHGTEITIHHAKTPAEAAELLRMTKEQIKIKEQYSK